jgi:hypothetical protein
MYLWGNFLVKTTVFDFLLNIEKMAKNSVKSPELGSNGVAAKAIGYLGTFTRKTRKVL